ncbi:hypothetical protein [Gallaecimonas mangrovi]|uniref:hypothetical protein n=1 Tax=Gallaecimonas mangrovi TaxID=2291597 RepID=UPI000E1FBB98|nr:hypothetical protein [Gallaecimonas mangrovi]
MAVPKFAYPFILILAVLALAFFAGKISAQWRPLWKLEGHWHGVYFQTVDNDRVKMDYRLDTKGKHIDAKVQYSDETGHLLGSREMNLLYLGKTPDTGRNLFSLENPPEDAELRNDSSLRLPFIMMIDKDHYFTLQRRAQGFIGTIFQRIDPADSH